MPDTDFIPQTCPEAFLQQERDALRARVDELSRAYAVQGLALEEEQTRVKELERENRRLDAIVHGQVCNSIDVDRWEALRRALFNEAE